MLHIKQPNRWNCVAASLAMVLRIPIEDIFELTGHDGSEVPPEWFHLDEPIRRRGHSMQEMIDVCLQLGYAATPIHYAEHFITSENAPIISFNKSLTEPAVRFHYYLHQADGLLFGLTKLGKRHCVAWDHETNLIYDPNGSTYELDRHYSFDPETFYLIRKSNQKLESWQKLS